jgi:hypothetical protein
VVQIIAAAAAHAVITWRTSTLSLVCSKTTQSRSNPNSANLLGPILTRIIFTGGAHLFTPARSIKSAEFDRTYRISFIIFILFDLIIQATLQSSKHAQPKTKYNTFKCLKGYYGQIATIPVGFPRPRPQDRLLTSPKLASNNGTERLYHYYLAGFRIVSALPLPGLTAADALVADSPEITIGASQLPETLSSITAVFPEGQCNENELLFTIPEAGRFLIRGGTEILVDQAPDSSPGDVSAYVLGTAFGVLWHQRGMPPLHASAIDVADGCVAFMGNSGAGKSTTVAALAARGHQVISDDVCVLEHGEQGIKVWPGLNRLRLWEDAMVALGCDQPGIAREFRGYNKYLIPLLPAQNPQNARRLRRVYQLETAAEGDRPSITRLQGAAAVEVLMQNIYRATMAEHMGRKANLFVTCAAAAREVAIYRFSRPLGFHALHEVVDALEEHLRQPIRERV